MLTDHSGRNSDDLGHDKPATQLESSVLRQRLRGYHNANGLICAETSSTSGLWAILNSPVREGLPTIHELVELLETQAFLERQLNQLG